MKMEHGARLTDSDRAVLDELILQARSVEAHVDLISEGDAPANVHVVLDGFACRYKLLADGRRSIMAFLVPGDFCDLHVAILGAMDHSIMTLTPCRMAAIPRERIQALTEERPRITRAMWWASLVDEGILREWLANVGQRPAAEQVAHLLCELLVRLQTVGRAEADGYALPLTQEELGDALGLTAVHVNRVLQRLRAEGLATFRNKRVEIHDLARLRAFAGFNPNYLHLNWTPSREE